MGTLRLFCFNQFDKIILVRYGVYLPCQDSLSSLRSRQNCIRYSRRRLLSQSEQKIILKESLSYVKIADVEPGIHCSKHLNQQMDFVVGFFNFQCKTKFRQSCQLLLVQNQLHLCNINNNIPLLNLHRRNWSPNYSVLVVLVRHKNTQKSLKRLT
jgi:hypothetical protein